MTRDLVGSASILLVTAVLSTSWQTLVSKTVREPYLDEVFHVRQAQVYCSGDFQTWDPKITTPPGLYFVSYLAFLLTGRCDIDALRISNVVTLCLIAIEARQLSKTLSHTFGEKTDQQWKHAHTALNIALFPPVFFFSALYYTDLQSLLVVLLIIHSTLLRMANDVAWQWAMIEIALGITSLLFRQTNVFWAAVFPLGLVALHQLKSGTAGAGTITKRVCVEDHVEVVINIVKTGFEALPAITRRASPQIAILCTFGAFIIWNGGVVLGDKSNHVATIHVTQMLYIWPILVFFSWPILARTVLEQGTLHKVITLIRAERPRLLLLIPLIALTVLTVHYNTIIHPFTLADNRHYVFYIFKILRQHPLLRYLAAPVYVTSGWLCIRTAEVAQTQTVTSKQKTFQASRPSTSNARIGLLLIWLVTASLSLVTAPLVEPRYFILPWTLWRLMVSPHSQTKASLTAETLWYLLVNFITGYVFLYRPFTWPQEHERLQRFMW